MQARGGAADDQPHPHRGFPMRALSLSLLYVMSLGILFAAYGFVPLG
jgi:hypothetical protein